MISSVFGSPIVGGCLLIERLPSNLLAVVVSGFVTSVADELSLMVWESAVGSLGGSRAWAFAVPIMALFDLLHAVCSLLLGIWRLILIGILRLRRGSSLEWLKGSSVLSH